MPEPKESFSYLSLIELRRLKKEEPDSYRDVLAIARQETEIDGERVVLQAEKFKKEPYRTRQPLNTNLFPYGLSVIEERQLSGGRTFTGSYWITVGRFNDAREALQTLKADVKKRGYK